MQKKMKKEEEAETIPLQQSTAIHSNKHITKVEQIINSIFPSAWRSGIWWRAKQKTELQCEELIKNEWNTEVEKCNWNGC